MSKRNILITNTIALGTALFAVYAPMAQSQTTGPSATTTALSYRAGLKLIYSDGLQSDSDKENRSAATPGETTRTLGLESAFFDLNWQTGKAYTLHVLLRPDALNSARKGTAKAALEADHRAGVVSRSKPEIELLDSYHMEWKISPALSASAGVFDPFPSNYLSLYDQTLEFGLTPQLPRKFNAVRLSWIDRTLPPPTSQPQPTTPTWQIDLYAYEGDRDRGEQPAFKSQTFDRTPGAADPHKGGALFLGWLPHQHFSLYLITGYQQARVLFGDVKSKGETFFADLNSHFTLPLAERIHILINYAYEQEGWKSNQISINQLRHQTLKFQSLAHVTENWSFMMGLYIGTNQFHVPGSWSQDPVSVNGHQVELGLATRLLQGLNLQFLTAYEKRSGDQQNFDGFQRASQADTSLRRFAIQLSHQIHSYGSSNATTRPTVTE